MGNEGRTSEKTWRSRAGERLPGRRPGPGTVRERAGAVARPPVRQARIRLRRRNGGDASRCTAVRSPGEAGLASRQRKRRAARGARRGRVTARRLPGRREHPEVAARDQRASRQSQADGRGPRGTAVGGIRQSRPRSRAPFRRMAAPAALRLWRIFPWDRVAAEGAPFGASHVTPRQVSGRFDLGGAPPVLYLGESAVHAIGEKIQRYRGQTLEPADLREFGKPLSLVEATVVAPPASIVDLCDPAELVRFGCRPDQLMSRDVLRTQSIARKLYEGGLGGFRVWSALTGDWTLHGDLPGCRETSGKHHLRQSNGAHAPQPGHFLKPRASWRSP